MLQRNLPPALCAESPKKWINIYTPILPQLICISMTLQEIWSKSNMRIKLELGTHPTYCTTQFLEDVYRSDHDRRWGGRLRGGLHCRWLEAHPEGASACCWSGSIKHALQSITISQKRVGSQWLAINSGLEWITCGVTPCFVRRLVLRSG